MRLLKGGICLLLLIGSCSHRPGVQLGPPFTMRELGPNVYGVQASDIKSILERLGCGQEQQCTLQYGGEVLMAKTGPTTLVVQIPLKTTDQVLKDAGCGEQYVCTLDQNSVTILKRK